MDVYWWLSALTEYVYCPACWIILPHPWGKLNKTQLFGKQHFKGSCENFQFLILLRICSQKIKDSQSRLKKNVQSLWFLLHEAKKKGGSLYPTLPYYLPFAQCKSQSQVTKQKKEAGNFAFASAMLWGISRFSASDPGQLIGDWH